VPKLNTHQILVETEVEEVNVVIADHGGVAGGFAKFFNRVIDSGGWGVLAAEVLRQYHGTRRCSKHCPDGRRGSAG
jgi:hypothetical protein